MKTGIWNKKTEDRLKQLLKENKSSGQIATILKTTTGAVVGKVKRMGLHFRYKKLQQKNNLLKTKWHPFVQYTNKPPKPHEPEKQLLPLPKSKPIQLDELKNHQCAFPFGKKSPYLFCGMTKNNLKKSYCDAHENISRQSGSADNPPYLF